MALLVQFLVAFGNAVGRGPHFIHESTRHGTNINAVLVGKSSRGRKGTSWDHSKKFFGEIDERWAKDCLTNGLSSGEGVIYHIRDSSEKDDGVSDKRLLVVEPEFASVLRLFERQGNTLSPIIRESWDSGNLRNMVKNQPHKVTGGHISIIGHITETELKECLTLNEMCNGLANRFLFVKVERSKLLPEGGIIDPTRWQVVRDWVRESVEFAKGVDELKRDGITRELWRAVYRDLTTDVPGILGSIISRAEAQVTRLAVINALLDRSSEIKSHHLESALAIWEYCSDSCREIFGESLGNAVADTIYTELMERPKGLTRTQIRDLFNRNKSAIEIQKALELLEGAGLAYCIRSPTGGRNSEVWFVKNTTKTTYGELNADLSSMSLFPGGLHV
jgi:hypothetical protein